jgi:hypothetical protein
VYYKAREQAIQNGSVAHLMAFVRKTGPIGVNSSSRNSAKFRKRYKNSCEIYHEVHAEVDLILKLREVPTKISVMRFLKDGTVTMAKPCIHCQHFLKHKGVKTVRFTNWEGFWEEMKL